VLHVSGWTKWLSLIVIAVGIMVSLPNVLNDRMLARMPSWLPHTRVNFGLDLQGGSSILLQVDLPEAQKAKSELMMNDMGAALRKAKINFTALDFKADTAEVTVTDTARYGEAKTLLQGLNPLLANSLTGAGRSYDLIEAGNGKIQLRQTKAFGDQTRQQILAQSVEVVRRRVDALGTAEASVVPQMPDRIVVEVPGLSDPAQLQAMLGKTARMTFQLVDEPASNDLATNPDRKTAPVGSQILSMMDPRAPKGAAEQKIVVKKRVMVDGSRLTDAQPGFDSQTSQPVINFRFDSVGAKAFGDVTKANVNHRFAIVLDNKVLMAPNIIGPILGGSGQITNIGTTQEATTLAILLRSGALPTTVRTIEQRTVGAELGADSIKAGRIAAIAGLGLVMLFMVLRYGLFGIFADLALAMNLILLLAALTQLATLTLPGIAGIVLTLGMAVDANVLIFERIREEQRNGRGMLAAIDAGFKRAMATIIDANATHVLAAAVLFNLGQGPVKGFAVALFLGIATSFFTSVVVTRLIVVTWLNIARPRTLVI